MRAPNGIEQLRQVAKGDAAVLSQGLERIGGRVVAWLVDLGVGGVVGENLEPLVKLQLA